MPSLAAAADVDFAEEDLELVIRILGEMRVGVVPAVPLAAATLFAVLGVPP